MRLHELNVQQKHKGKRLGRGIGSGKGKTAGRGTKGQRARSGNALRPGFEGGQNPLSQRLPKLRGFKRQSTPVQIVKTSQLAGFRKDAVITVEKLHEAGLVSSTKQPVKLLFDGAVEKPVKLTVHKVSKQAKQAVEDAGGNVNFIE